MTTWGRARVVMQCGSCGEVIRVGAPVCLIQIAPKIIKRRCAPCAGGAPPDLPSAVVLDETPRPAIDLTRFGVLPLDFSGPRVEREPGEEG
jgi:hypothetical protein